MSASPVTRVDEVAPANVPDFGIRHARRIPGGMTRMCLALLLGATSLWCRGQEEACPKSIAARAPIVPSDSRAAPFAPAHESLRDPFWPVDYIRPMQPGEKFESAVTIGDAEWRILEKHLHELVKGVSRLPARNGATDYLVLINGNVYGVGDSVSLAANGKNYRWKVVRITLRDGPAFERITQPAPSPAAK